MPSWWNTEGPRNKVVAQMLMMSLAVTWVVIFIPVEEDTAVGDMRPVFEKHGEDNAYKDRGS